MSLKRTLWISHSALSAFDRCPYLYYLEYIYRNPRTGRRIQIVNPYLSLGSAVHETIEGLSEYSPKERSRISLKERFEKIFESYKGVQGGFISERKEGEFKKRGLEMVERVEKSSFLERPSVATKSNLLSVDLMGENVKLVGSIDWIEELPEGEAHIIDFKTGNNKERNGSLQLPIYSVLAKNNIPQKIKKVSYWYLQHDDHPVSQDIEEADNYLESLKEKASVIEKAVINDHFPCSYPGRCFACNDYEKIFQGEAELISSNQNHSKDAFCVFKENEVIEKILEEDFLDEREKKMFEIRVKRGMETASKELRLSREKSGQIAESIKEKLKNNLRPKELKVIVKTLKE